MISPKLSEYSLNTLQVIKSFLYIVMFMIEPRIIVSRFCITYSNLVVTHHAFALLVSNAALLCTTHVLRRVTST